MLRWGYLLAGLLLVLALLGAKSQMTRKQRAALLAENAALRARIAELEAELTDRQNPKRVMEWARGAGFVPITEGRWAR